MVARERLLLAGRRFAGDLPATTQAPPHKHQPLSSRFRIEVARSNVTAHRTIYTGSMSAAEVTPGNDLLETLRRHWGYDSFRPLQERIVRSLLDGQDSCVVMPTGGGKARG